MAVFTLVFMCALCAWYLWAIHTLNKTYNQRERLLNLMNCSNTTVWGYYLLMFKCASFGAHWRALLTFRDPWKLYDPELSRLIHGISA